MSPRNLSESQDTESNWDYERRVRTFRRRLREADWTWLTACMGVVVRDFKGLIIYFIEGKSPSRHKISCLNQTFPVHLFYQLYMQETGNLMFKLLV